MKRQIIIYFLALCMPLTTALASQEEVLTQWRLKSDFCHLLDAIEGEFNSYYAPRQWKNEHLGWVLGDAITEAKDKIYALDSFERCEYQAIVRDFFSSVKDYHIGALFHDSSYSCLPFDVITLEGKTFLSYVSRDLISEEVFPYGLGDEVLEFDGVPVADVLEQIQASIGGSNDATNRGLADKLLTVRPGRLGLEVPRGPITIRLRTHEEDKEHALQIAWDYHKGEYFTNPEVHKGQLCVDRSQRNTLDSMEEQPKDLLANLQRFINPRMEFPTYRVLQHATRDRADQTENPFAIGAKYSILPPLGEVVWDAEEAANASVDEFLDQHCVGTDACFYPNSFPFQAYIYLDEDERKIGFIRIPSYSSAWAAKDFGKIIQHMEEEVDALVIDQMYNPGGYVQYCYALASMLAIDPLLNARHQMAINDCDYFWAQVNQRLLSGIQNDEDARSILGDAICEYPLSYQTLQMWLHHLDFIIDEWEAGHVLTRPFHLGMIDQINPNPRYQFTKPILLLINEMDFSCGDHFPVLMQDNKRAVLMGTRTAGAGGCVTASSLGVTNHCGLDYFRITCSLGWRPNGQPYEDLGVTPDVLYELTVDDIQNEFAPMMARVNEEISKLLPPAPPPEDDEEVPVCKCPGCQL